MCCNQLPRPIFLLIRNRLVPANFILAHLHLQNQVAVLIPTNPLGPANVESYATWVSARCYDKIKLKLLLIAVVDQVDSGINSFVLHLGVGWNIAAPLLRIVANEEVALAGQFIHSAHRSMRARTHELHTQVWVPRLPFRFAARQPTINNRRLLNVVPSVCPWPFVIWLAFGYRK